MATIITAINALGITASTLSTNTADSSLVDALARQHPIFGSSAVFLEPGFQAPFDTIRGFFDYLRADSRVAAALNATYPKRGILKTAATNNALCDQKLTVDLSPSRSGQVPDDLKSVLGSTGYDEILEFFNKVHTNYVNDILSTLSKHAGADLYQAHTTGNVNFRLCDYNPETADPESENGCGAHTDYGTFSIIFQDGNSGLEIEDPKSPGSWMPVPGDATVVLAGWCAVILSGGSIPAARHRVRRVPGVRRLSAVLFVAPDLDAKLKPMDAVAIKRPFSRSIMCGEVNVGWFKEVMGKKWRKREGNEEMGEEGDETAQDTDIERFIWQ